MTTIAKKILLAEDDLDLRHEIGTFLKRRGFAVVCVEDGYQATEFTLREKPDLLLLDVHMPAGDGFSVHERVQRHPEVALVPVIYMTRDPSTTLDRLAAADGASTLLHKPFELEALLQAVHEALDVPSTEAA